MDRTRLVGFCLNFPASFEFEGEAKIQSLAASLSIYSENKWWRVGWLRANDGYLPTAVGGSRGDGRRWVFKIDLTAAELAALDAARGDDGLRVQAEITIGFERSGQAPSTSTASPTHRIPTSDWHRLMQECGACDILTFSLLLPKGDTLLAETVRHLRAAQDELHSGRRPRVVCRHALQAMEAMTAWLGDGSEFEAAKATQRKKQTLDQRLQLVRDAIQHVAGGSMHGDPDAAAMPYDIPVARALVALSIATLSVYLDRA